MYQRLRLDSNHPAEIERSVGATKEAGVYIKTTKTDRFRLVSLEHVELHGLRHFVATELLTAGIDPRTISNRLGHARTSTTLDIYWAWVPAQDEAAAEHLDAILDQPDKDR